MPLLKAEPPVQPPPVKTPEQENAELLESVRVQFADVYDISKRMIDKVEESTAAMHREMRKNEREMVETRVQLTRLMNRVDSQLMALILANLASGVGVAALMMAATQAFN